MRTSWSLIATLLLLSAACNPAPECPSGTPAPAAPSAPAAAPEQPSSATPASETPDPSAASVAPSTPSDPAPTPQRTSLSPERAATALRHIAPHLPSDVDVIAFIDLAAFYDTFTAPYTTWLAPAFPAADLAQLEQDIVALVVQHMGWSPASIDWLAIAISSSTGWFGIHLQGALRIEDDVDATEIGGHRFYSLPMRNEGRLLALELDGGYLLVFGQDAEAYGQSLASGKLAGASDQLDRLAQITAECPPGLIMIAADLDRAMAALGYPAPFTRELHSAAFALGDNLSLQINGEASAIEALAGLWAQSRQVLLALAEAELAQSADQGLDAAITATVLHRLAGPFLDRIAPTFSGEQARVTISGFGDGSGVMIIGVLSALAIPSFMKYIQRAKEAEAHHHLMVLRHKLSLYYIEHRQFPQTGPEGWCTAGNLRGDKSPPEATDWSQWEALEFRISEPHYFRYCYRSQDAHRFTISAEAALGTTGRVDTSFGFVGTGDPDSRDVNTTPL